MMTRQKFVVAALGVALLASGAGAALAANASSSGGAGDDSSAYAAEFSEARQAASSPLEKDVLADGEITADEYEEASSAYVSCLNDHGWVSSIVQNGSTSMLRVDGRAEGEKWDADNAACQKGTVRIIEPLYSAVESNPYNVDHLATIANCLRNGGFVDQDFTVEDLKTFSGDRAGEGPWMKNQDSLQCFQ